MPRRRPRPLKADHTHPVKAELSTAMRVPGRGRYAQEFVEVVVRHAMKHGSEDAAAYYGVVKGTIERWRRAAADLSQEADSIVLSRSNPYRGTEYNLQRRLGVSDKLFAELEHTVEIERVKSGGYVPSDVLQRLVSSYSMLTDKRRLEEGAYTALVAEAKDPEEIFKEGQTRVIEFRKRNALGAGS
jgi:hypothetical protein